MKEHVWYYARDGVRFGPFAFAELHRLARSGEVLPDDLVWLADAPENVAAAGQCPGLYPHPPSPVPPTTARGKSLAGRALFHLGAAVFWVVVTFLVFGGIAYLMRGPTPAAPPPQPLPVETGFRQSSVGLGMVLRLRNVDPKRTLPRLFITVTAVGGEAAGRTSLLLNDPLPPAGEVELGWRELGGWQLARGEAVRISSLTPGDEPRVVVVPAKAGAW